MNYHQTRDFVIGALAHGMSFDDAFNLVSGAQQQRQENRSARTTALSDLMQKGIDWSMQEGADPNQIAYAVGLMAQSQGLPNSQIKAAVSALSGMGGNAPANAWNEDVQANFDDEIAPIIQKYQTSGQSIADARHAAQQVALMDPEVAAQWQLLKPQFDAAVDAAWTKNLPAEQLQTFLDTRNQNLLQRAGVAPTEAPAGGGGGPGIAGRLAQGALGYGALGAGLRTAGRLPGLSALQQVPKLRQLPGMAYRGISSLLGRGGGETPALPQSSSYFQPSDFPGGAPVNEGSALASEGGAASTGLLADLGLVGAAGLASYKLGDLAINKGINPAMNAQSSSVQSSLGLMDALAEKVRAGRMPLSSFTQQMKPYLDVEEPDIFNRFGLGMLSTQNRPTDLEHGLLTDRYQTLLSSLR